ncbi:hypothetical protein PGH44_02025 [Legionella pneumophila]|nr:hypothetical protein PGH44_02025 [Legionella pneumophila]
MLRFWVAVLLLQQQKQHLLQNVGLRWLLNHLDGKGLRCPPININMAGNKE